MRKNKLFEYLYSNEVTPDELYQACEDFKRLTYEEACENTGEFFRKMQREGKRKATLRRNKNLNIILEKMNDHMYEQYRKYHENKRGIKGA